VRKISENNNFEDRNGDGRTALRLLLPKNVLRKMGNCKGIVVPVLN
jgi:hypothetical protein